jgi:hypothetical protein
MRIKAGAVPGTFAGPNGSRVPVSIALGSDLVVTTDAADNLYRALGAAQE